MEQSVLPETANNSKDYTNILNPNLPPKVVRIIDIECENISSKTEGLLVEKTWNKYEKYCTTCAACGCSCSVKDKWITEEFSMDEMHISCYDSTYILKYQNKSFECKNLKSEEIPESEYQLSMNKTSMEDSLLNQTENITSENKIDPKIIEAFKTQEWINVIVVLKDNSDVNISSGVTNAEKITLSLKKDKQNLIVQSEVIASLSESEFKVKSKSLAGRGFSGEISKKGLIKLENDPRVSEIRKPIEGGLATNE